MAHAVQQLRPARRLAARRARAKPNSPPSRRLDARDRFRSRPQHSRWCRRRGRAPRRPRRAARRRRARAGPPRGARADLDERARPRREASAPRRPRRPPGRARARGVEVRHRRRARARGGAPASDPARAPPAPSGTPPRPRRAGRRGARARTRTRQGWTRPSEPAESSTARSRRSRSARVNGTGVDDADAAGDRPPRRRERSARRGEDIAPRRAAAHRAPTRRATTRASSCAATTPRTTDTRPPASSRGRAFGDAVREGGKVHRATFTDAAGARAGVTTPFAGPNRVRKSAHTGDRRGRNFDVRVIARRPHNPPHDLPRFSHGDRRPRLRDAYVGPRTDRGVRAGRVRTHPRRAFRVGTLEEIEEPVMNVHARRGERADGKDACDMSARDGPHAR